MNLLGKLLILVNLVAGAGFVYLATQDWRGRQNITAAGLRQLMLLQGLPLDGGPDQLPADADSAVSFKFTMAGGVPTETVSPKLLTAFFANAGGGAAEGGVALGGTMPVSCQVSEAKRVLAIVKGEVDKADGAKAKTALLRGWLILQPETYDERVEIMTLVQQENADELAKRLYARFDQVINPPQPQDVSALKATEGDTGAELADKLKKMAEVRTGGVKDETERRHRLAHLLVHLDRDSGWQKRAMLVVGIRGYVKAVGDQAARFREMGRRVDRLILDDQEAFTGEYASLRGLAILRTQLVRDLADQRAKLQDQKRKDEDFIAQRRTQLKQLGDQLARIKADVGDLLAKQTAVEKQLFEIQREVGLTLDEVYKLYAELETKERDRLKKQN